jgi:hypothetical protein
MAHSDQYTPTSICNQALQAAGLRIVLGDIEEGTEAAAVCLRNYSECVRQMLRGAHWDWARRQTALTLVGDASGQTVGVSATVPGGFQYSYAYPADCAKLRFIPANYTNVISPAPSGNITPAEGSSPISTATVPVVTGRLEPSRFLIANDPNLPGDGNAIPGSSPIGSTIICSNMQNAIGVYTLQAMWPNLWDSLFRSAVVDYIASEIAFVLHTDKKLGLAVQDRLAGRAQAKLSEARRTNGNESWASSDLAVDWMRFRMSGGYGYWGNNWGVGPGVLFGGWESVGFSGGNPSGY